MTPEDEPEWWKDWEFLRPYIETALVLVTLSAVGILLSLL